MGEKKENRDLKAAAEKGQGQRTFGATYECCLLCSLSARTAQLCFMVLTPILLMRQHFNITRCNPDGAY